MQGLDPTVRNIHLGDAPVEQDRSAALAQAGFQQIDPTSHAALSRVIFHDIRLAVGEPGIGDSVIQTGCLFEGYRYVRLECDQPDEAEGLVGVRMQFG